MAKKGSAALMPTTPESLSHSVALEGRQDLRVYKHLARTLFALETRFRLSDIHTAAADAVTDGGDDKKCDVVYVDRDSGDIVVVQSYNSVKERQEVSSSKASDLNTAINWLLNSPLAEIPKTLQGSASELRSSLEDNEVRSFQLWFVHNMDESKNVDKELKQVERTAKALLSKLYPKIELDEVVAIQVGRKTLEEWYEALETPILVSDEFEINVEEALKISGDQWAAAVTSVPAVWLYDAFRKYGSKLFSANVRDYLGSRRSTKNVNHTIKESAEKNPGKFWVYNNGITALVHDFELVGNKLKIHGLSIVNGAQTTGAIGSLSVKPSPHAFVPARFVTCTDTETVKEIIQFNNTQNAVKVTDYRSNDPVQRRLRQEFSSFKDTTYLGGRRGSADDKIRRNQSVLPTDSCSQALASFHLEPGLAYHRKSELWESDKLYSRFFNDETTASHVLLTIGLLKTIEQKKRELMTKDPLSSSETEQLSFLRNRGATFLLTAAIGSCVEIFVGQVIPNKFRLGFGNASLSTAILYWQPIVDVAISFAPQLQAGTGPGLKTNSKFNEVISTFRQLVLATKGANATTFSSFAKNIVIRD